MVNSNNMKQLNMLIKWHNAWIKLALVVYLLIAVQASFCSDNKIGRPMQAIFTSVENIQDLDSIIANQKNISLMMDGTTYLHAAVRTDKPEIVNVILERIKQDQAAGKNDVYENGFPNTIDKAGYTPLGEAIKRGKLAIVRLLLALDLVDVNKVGHKLTSLLLALQEKKNEIAESLLACDRSDKMDVTSPHPDTDATPLHIAIQHHFRTLVETLVKKLMEQDRQDVLFVKDKQQKTPLDVAAQYNDQYAFGLLFEQIRAVFKDQPDKVNQCLFTEDNKACSVFALAYLPEPFSLEGVGNAILSIVLHDEDNTSFNMFKYVLCTVQGFLKQEDWQKILQEIDLLETEKKLNLKYADQLRRMVNTSKSDSNIPSKITNDAIEQAA